MVSWVAKGGFQGGLGSVAIKALNEPPQKPQSPVAITVAIGRTRYSEISGGVKRGGFEKMEQATAERAPSLLSGNRKGGIQGERARESC